MGSFRLASCTLMYLVHFIVTPWGIRFPVCPLSNSLLEPLLSAGEGGCSGPSEGLVWKGVHSESRGGLRHTWHRVHLCLPTQKVSSFLKSHQFLFGVLPPHACSLSSRESGCAHVSLNQDSLNKGRLHPRVFVKNARKDTHLSLLELKWKRLCPWYLCLPQGECLPGNGPAQWKPAEFKREELNPEHCKIPFPAWAEAHISP